MKVAERITKREPSWRELDALLHRLSDKGISRRPSPDSLGPHGEIERERDGTHATVSPALQRGVAIMPAAPLDGRDMLRLAELYRAACADLMLAEAHDLPGDTVAYLHALVARGHSALYRSKGLRFRDWAGELLVTVPRRLRRDPMLPLAFMIFYGTFFLFGGLAATQPGIAEKVIGEGQIALMEEMYAEPLGEMERQDSAMAGFYILNNAGIGLQCFAAGITFGLGTIYILFTNGMILGTVFGHMFTTPYAGNFYEFVTAHGPFELTAIVFAAAAGFRLGWGLIDTQGQSRIDSLRREAKNSLPTVGAAVFLFVLAAFLEGFISASPLPYPVKAGIAILSGLTLVLYVSLGGRSPGRANLGPMSLAD